MSNRQEMRRIKKEMRQYRYGIKNRDAAESSKAVMAMLKEFLPLLIQLYKTIKEIEQRDMFSEGAMKATIALQKMLVENVKIGMKYSTYKNDPLYTNMYKEMKESVEVLGNWLRFQIYLDDTYVDDEMISKEDTEDYKEMVREGVVALTDTVTSMFKFMKENK